MRKILLTPFCLVQLLIPLLAICQTPGFTAPDTICVTQDINITNTSAGASSYYWNFCVADILHTPPVGVNLGDVGGVITWPVFSDFVEYNGNFYVFVVNHFGPSLGIARLDFGNSLLNTPTGVNLGNFNNTLRNRLEGIQIVKEGGKWYAFIVGGDPDPLYNDVPQIVRIDFGTDIANPSPTATDLGNIGGMYQPLDLYMFRENGIWHGFTVNKNGSLTRFEFVNGIENTPDAQNYPLGLNYPTGVNVVNDNGDFFVFVAIANDNSLARLDFGNSLLNTPAVKNLGNPGNALHAPRDITILRFCDAIVGFAVNQPGSSDLVRLDFHNNLRGVPDGVSLGNMNGNLSFPHSLSRLFRVDDNVYTFITNVDNRTITRVQFPSCTNASIPSFSGQSPPSLKYNAPGIYNINLTIDDGLPTQSSLCKQIVVVPEPVHTPLQTIVLPSGGSVKIGTSNPSSTYQWFPSGPNSDSITVTSEGLYVVETNGYGCSNRDSFRVMRQASTAIQFTTQDTLCVGTPVNITNAPASATSYYWNFCVSNINQTIPTGVNLGNIGNQLRAPVFMDYAYYNGNYYGFVVNHNPTSLVRLDFGNSLLNTPTAVPLGDFGVLQTNSWGEGIQVIQSQGNWYAVIVGGYTPNGSNPAMVKIEFGTNLANPTPVATDWGNIGGVMDQPIDLHIFQDGNNWYGLSTNAESNVITRFNFGADFATAPTVDNLGNVDGQLAYPTGVFAVNDNGDWKVFVVNGGDRTRSTGTYALIRLDFGSSLLNTPTAVNLGNPGNFLKHPRDITILKSCGQIIGLTVNGHLGNSNITKFDFSNDIAAVPSAVDLGNIGSLGFPHSISQLFREGDNLYAFVTNVDNNTITRLQFSGCTNSSIPSSTLATPPPITYNAPGVYNINLTVDDGLATQASFCRQVVVVPQPAHTPIQTIILRPGESVKIGTGNISGNYKWNTTSNNTDSIVVSQEGLYYVETTGYGCSNTDSFRIVFSTADFSYEQNPCDPLNITFKNETPGSTVIDWDFGNGANAPGNDNPATQYPSFGSYDVTLIVINLNGVNESITKTIVVDVQNDSLIITSDTTICAGSSIQLNAVNALNYCWTPSSTLNATNIANPIATPVATTTYYLNSSVAGNNLIVNGNFSSGNTGFTTGYSNATINTTEGEYHIGSNPGAWNPNFQSTCPDHSGAGNMMFVNGNPVPDINVWSQTVTVTPNTNYAFSTWIQSLFKDNPAQLMFSINNIPIGNMITASLPICNWTQFYTTWNSGDNTTAVISIINKNTIVWGNDFALDDISFAPVTVKRDSVIITVEEPLIKTVRDTTICEGAGVQLDATAGFVSYTWLPGTGLSDQKIMNPIAMPVVTTDYIVTGKTINGCGASDTVNITVNKAPDFITNNDTLLCGAGQVQLSAIGDAVSYAWSPGMNLPDSTVSNPLAEVLSTTQFVVTGKSANNCLKSDTVEVVVSIPVDIQARPDTSICEGVAFKLYAAGDAANFSWSPSAGLSDPSIESPVTQPISTTEYVITASNPDGCTDKDTVLVTVKPIPVVSITNDTLICPEVNVQLTASGGSSYSWTPSATLSDPFIANPTAAPFKNTTYVVEVNDIATGCTSSDSVAIALRPYPVFSAIADTAVCKGTDILMYANGGDSYQWSPAASLDNPLSANPVAQPLSSTVYSVYMIENTCYFDTTIDVHITVNPVPEVIAQRSNDINCVVTTAQLNATGANAYQWSPAVHLDNAFKPNPVASIDTTTLFKVVGKNNYGCTAEDTVTIKVTKEGNPLYLVPNAFTPNGDGINDCFSVRKWGNVQLEELSVYNRWGEKVFYSKNPMDCWDGTYKGIEQPSGTFIYVIRAKTFCGEIDRKGLITLIR